MDNTADVTRLLQRVTAGEAGAVERLLPLVYDELRRIARRYIRPNEPVTLDPTGLVHEAYMRLVDQTRAEYNDRDHFLAVCSVVMRNLVIDFARQRKSLKRGGKRDRVTLDENEMRIDEQAEELLALNEALGKLDEYDPHLTKVVECRYFAGLTEPETACALGVSERTVRRHWSKAKALLHQMLTG